MSETRMGLHLLETLTSALYDDPIILFREYVQNSIDSFNNVTKKILNKQFHGFHIAINIDRQKKNIIILDNGFGIEEKDFLSKMKSLGISNKGQSNIQIGFRGIGRLSAMPFCDELIFTNKLENSSKIQVFKWYGSKFHELLSNESEPELTQSIDKITNYDIDDYEGDSSDHFFKVEIINYNIEIIELLKQKNFKNKLCMILPLQYHPEFNHQKEILSYYSKFMGYSLERFSFPVELDGEKIYKLYKNTNILESGINFWELRYRSKKKDIPGEKIGILWYTFDRKVTANSQDEPYGILVRSKNMLMGDHNALANALFRSKTDDYIATFRELTQTLQGVYGEMLLDSPQLNDNARRDWFRIDEASIELRDIIFDFMKRLFTYRYVASKTFNAIENDTNRKKLTEAFINLTSNFKPKEFVDDFYNSKRAADDNKPTFDYADEDIPQASLTNKKFYDKIAHSLHEYFMQKNDPLEFLKIRAHIKRSINKDE